ncbi:unnamed protein product [Camellia sinensis]
MTFQDLRDFRERDSGGGNESMITRSNLAEQLREYQIRSKYDWASVSIFSSTSNLTHSRVSGDGGRRDLFKASCLRNIIDVVTSKPYDPIVTYHFLTLLRCGCCM